jgi:UDPglucose 6-dehydrogenase
LFSKRYTAFPAIKKSGSSSHGAIPALLKEQAFIQTYDHKVKYHQMLSDLDSLQTCYQKMNEEHLVFEYDPNEAVKHSHAVAVITEWDEFKTYNWEKIYQLMKKPAFVFDGRNILDRGELGRLGFEAWGIGKV